VIFMKLLKILKNKNRKMRLNSISNHQQNKICAIENRIKKDNKKKRQTISKALNSIKLFQTFQIKWWDMVKMNTINITISTSHSFKHSQILGCKANFCLINFLEIRLTIMSAKATWLVKTRKWKCLKIKI